MISIIFIVLLTCLGVLISINYSPETTWFDYYRGVMGGIFVSGVVLYFVNKRRRAKELEKDKQ